MLFRSPLCVFPFGSTYITLKGVNSKTIRRYIVHNIFETVLCGLWFDLHQMTEVFAAAIEDVQHKLCPGAEPICIPLCRRGGTGGELGIDQPLQSGEALAVQVFPEEGLGIRYFLHRLF